jgi:biotin transporter BioY
MHEILFVLFVAAAGYVIGYAAVGFVIGSVRANISHRRYVRPL